MDKPVELSLGELKIHSQYLEDTLMAIIHTILYIRAPETVVPKDRMCQQLSPLVYNTVGIEDVDKAVRYMI